MLTIGGSIDCRGCECDFSLDIKTYCSVNYGAIGNTVDSFGVSLVSPVVLWWYRRHNNHTGRAEPYRGRLSIQKSAEQADSRALECGNI